MRSVVAKNDCSSDPQLQAIDEKISARRTTANDPKETPFERTKALQDLEIFHEERRRILRLDGEKSAKEELDLIAGVQESAPNGSTPIALTDAIGPNPGDTIDFTDFTGIVRAGQMTPAILDSPERMAEFRAAARAPCRLTFPIQEFSEGTKDSVVEPSKLKELSESSKEIPDSDD